MNNSIKYIGIDQTIGKCENRQMFRQKSKSKSDSEYVTSMAFLLQNSNNNNNKNNTLIQIKAF